MSTNFVSYENAEDIFQGYADRIKANTEFVGTQAEWDALSAEDKAKYVLVNITDDNSSTGGEKEIINGYYNPADGKFYIDSSYTTEIAPDSACIYVDLNENKMYRYDSLTLQYVVMSGGGGADYVAGYGIKIDDSTHEISTKTFVGTQAEWDNLTSAQKAKFDSVNITDDATPVNYEPGHAIVDSTGTEAPQRNNLKFDGMTVTDDSTSDTTVVAPVPYTAGDKITITDHEIAVDETVTTTFTGTRAEWEALSATEKAAYNIVNLTDDPAGSGMVVVDVIQNGNMNAVTSNAVYNQTQFKLIATGEGATYAAQLASLKNAYTGLTTGQKLRAVLVVGGDSTYINTRLAYGRFVKSQLNSDLKAQYIEGLYLDNAHAIKVDNVNGSITSTDYSSSNAPSIELWA